ncbi:MAG: TIGR03663 family protein [Dehalococcoidia bacterium]|nr:TIGR03663 family protein [Dehalococcoidia bacterium]
MTVQPMTTANPRRPLERLFAVRIALRWELVAYAVVFAVAIGLRFFDLGTRALHHDESIHAQWSWGLLQGSYRHSPIFHGPLYYHAEALVFFVFGANDYTSRVSAAIFGMAIVAAPLLLRKRLGQAGTLAAVAFIALSPTLVYYSRFFREDIYMALFTMLMVVAMWRYFDEGRDRWLYLLAAAFTGNVLTKEGAFLAIAVFLVYVDVYMAVQLATRTLVGRSNRYFREEFAALAAARPELSADELSALARERSDISTPFRRLLLTIGFAPFAWVVAAFWPFLGKVRDQLDWGEEMPRPADVLVLLGTFTLPLLTPVSRFYLLEPLGIVEKDRLSWELHLQGTIAQRDAVAIAGLFAVTTSIAAFAGLQWRPKLWAIAFISCTVVYLTLMTSFWTNLNGLISGPWGSLDYWKTQQHVSRGDQPWFYYYMLLPAYEFLPLAICIGGAWWSVVRGNAFSRFLVVWLVGMFAALSWGAEKMPWLNTHLALPACVLAAYSVQQAWAAWTEKPAAGRMAATLGSVALLSAGALLAIAYMPGGAAFLGLRVVILAAAAGAVAYAAWPLGRRASATVILTAVIGALGVFSVVTMYRASFERGDNPRDLLIYTQSSGELAQVAREIDALAAASGKGFEMPIAVDSADSFAWPWAWYLRDYKSVSYVDFSTGVPAGQFDVLLVNQSNVSKAQDYVANSSAIQYGSPERYPHRWWFDETYKYAMSAKPNGICTGLQGDCGPFHLTTWKHAWNGFVHKGWTETWLKYWRDHDPGRPNGSVDAFAFFPANFDRASGKLLARPVEPPKPGTDDSGHAFFGGAGSLPGLFFSPVDIERDAAGNLYVIDSGTKKLQKFDPQGNFIAAVDIRVKANDASEQSQPWGLAVAPGGEVVVADTFGWRIRVFDRDLKPIATFGQPPDTTKKPGPFDLFGPRDAAIDSEGHIWVTDTGNDRIQVFTMQGEFVRTVGSSGKGEGQFDEPVGIDIAKDGSIYVADMYNRRVEILNPDGSYKGQFAVDGWGGQQVDDKPYLRVLTDGRVALSLPSLNQVRVYSASGATFVTVDPGKDPLARPYGIVQTPDAKLWVVENGTARVRQFPIP